ncbi:16S rRNA (guanine(527)-N(7))-methyltransferase RsmG [Chelativorans sp. M5D2P16]|uniref:16S rRNA (guanine(527)-N(7))-methyltransferase RsmG n=1 Tax=Chelativorans sp. M5D2P16 TaxID=3095678 RepID=UPI002ACAE7AD|nr:16S rRNA (guanine(527)-N(7))-methyltransferase RsmG [Chelativorans sp. M5D2P16]MDZ5697417.1 16S rRNA (guanine(527)-N(7))-methyltransferase RsmG [Chelativorans sp. M5D2P16]
MSDAVAFDALQKAAGPVSRETFARLQSFEREFNRWAVRINLAAPSTLPHLWERHILDSAQLIRLAPEATLWVDLGSGGGFPGAVVAILLTERPGSHVDLIESNRKKAAFLQTVLAGLKAPARVHSRRIEESYDLVAQPEIITARALAPLPRLLELAEPWLSKGARALFHKGRDYQREIEESYNVWQFDLVKHGESLGGDGVILEINNLRRAR